MNFEIPITFSKKKYENSLNDGLIIALATKKITI